MDIRLRILLAVFAYGSILLDLFGSHRCLFCKLLQLPRLLTLETWAKTPIRKHGSVTKGFGTLVGLVQASTKFVGHFWRKHSQLLLALRELGGKCLVPSGWALCIPSSFLNRVDVSLSVSTTLDVEAIRRKRIVLLNHLVLKLIKPTHFSLDENFGAHIRPGEFSNRLAQRFSTWTILHFVLMKSSTGPHCLAYIRLAIWKRQLVYTWTTISPFDTFHSCLRDACPLLAFLPLLTLSAVCALLQISIQENQTKLQMSDIQQMPDQLLKVCFWGFENETKLCLPVDTHALTLLRSLSMLARRSLRRCTTR